MNMRHATDSIEQLVNHRFTDVQPGFFDAGQEPVMYTPAVVPAAMMATQTSILCAAC
jgi:hypothetical protein